MSGFDCGQMCTGPTVNSSTNCQEFDIPHKCQTITNKTSNMKLEKAKHPHEPILHTIRSRSICLGSVTLALHKFIKHTFKIPSKPNLKNWCIISDPARDAIQAGHFLRVYPCESESNFCHWDVWDTASGGWKSVPRWSFACLFKMDVKGIELIQ